MHILFHVRVEEDDSMLPSRKRRRDTARCNKGDDVEYQGDIITTDVLNRTS